MFTKNDVINLLSDALEALHDEYTPIELAQDDEGEIKANIGGRHVRVVVDLEEYPDEDDGDYLDRKYS